jgi:tripartite-type tricarboxylate transporter receptor subunit TctC
MASATTPDVLKPSPSQHRSPPCISLPRRACNIFAIAVTGNSPYKTVADLLKDAARQPGSVSYGTSGTGSIPHLGTSDIEASAKVDMTHVPYKGDGPMLQDLLAVRLSFGGLLVPAATPSNVLAALEASCEKAIQLSGYREWAKRANQVVDFKSSSGFEDRLRQDSQSKATTLKRLGL